MNTNLTGNTINNYNIEAYITEGGMGKIYRAKHTSLGRLVVVKQLHSQFTRDKHFKERFLNEAKILAKLNHQNIITVYDFIEDDNEFMIIMEYVDGDTIGKVIEKQGGGFHYARAINIFKQILSGFNYAHSEGIVHRDIKPTNIILQQNDVPKILDFGIARMLQKDLRITKAGTKMGSLLYMSPEQVLGLDVDSRSDIYSLGLLLYEMLSGDLPYNIINDTDYEIMECILKEEIKDINALIPGLPYGTGNIIRKACAKNTTDRFQTCNEFITALDKGTAPPIKNEVYQRITTKNSSQNKTTYQSPGGQYIETQRKNSTGIIIGIASFIIIVIIVISYILTTGTDTIDKTKKDGNKTSGTTENTPIKSDNPKSENENQIKQDVQSAFESWIKCWENMDLGCYSSYITSDYIYESTTAAIKNQNYNSRLQVLKKQFSEKSYIKITISNLRVTLKDNIAVINYFQIYNSSNYNDDGEKIVFLKKVNGSWKIYRDTFHE